MALINAAFTRASAAHAIRRNTGALLAAGVDTPLEDPSAGFLFRRQATNSFRNVRAEGEPPTHWSTNGAVGLTVTYVESGVDQDIPFVTYEVGGTRNGTTGAYINLPSAGVLFFADGDNMQVECFCGLDPAFDNVLDGANFQLRLHMPPSVEVVSPTFVPTTARLGQQPVLNTRIAPVGTTGLQGRIRIGGAIGTSPLFRLRVALPFGAAVGGGSAPVLSAPGDLAASTRLGDAAAELLSRFGVGADGGCTILARVMLLAAAPAGAAQNLIQIDDGSDANRFIVRNLAGGATIAPTRVLAGAVADGVAAAFTPGEFLTYAASISAGRLAISVNRGAVQAVTGGPVSGLAHLRFGPNLAGTAAPEAYLQAHRIVPYGLSDAELPGLTF